MPGDPAGNLAGETSNPVDSVPVPSSSHARGCSLCLGCPQSQSVLSQAVGASNTWLHPSVPTEGRGGHWHSQGVCVPGHERRWGGLGRWWPFPTTSSWQRLRHYQISAICSSHLLGLSSCPPCQGGRKAARNPRATLSRQCPPCLSFPTHNMEPVLISQQEKPDPAAHRDSRQGSVTILALSPTLSLPQALSPHHITGPGCSQMAPCSHYSHK